MNEPGHQKLNSAYSKSLKFAKSHYENFPVVSFLIPKNLRKHVAIIYWFARTADDYADEGNFSKGERLEKLNNFEFRLKQLLNGKAESDYEFALANTIIEKKLTTENFYNLIKAFKQDVIKNRYENFDEVIDYCKHSANPVGRLILELFDIRSEEAIKYSDKICTALQLTNFLQDVSIDYKKGRIYLPKDEMEMLQITEKLFEYKENNHKLKQLVKHSVDRIQNLFNEGKKLFPLLSGRLKVEIIWTVAGGEEILDQVRKNDYNVLNNRPELSKTRMLSLFLKSLI
ncbi:MAG: squalene synthase HpnC [Bacteroidetes bacterium]|nr:squalene synthase HpnC [Bacteroidota bacterium]